MSCPMQHEFPVGGLVPLFRRFIDRKDTNVLFHDYYVEYYQRFGITRDEMMCIMPAVMTVDVLSGCDVLKYVDEEKRSPSE